MNDLEKAIEAIEKQQSELKPYSAPHAVGEQLKDILRENQNAAGVVLQDLGNTGMGIAACEKKIEAFARNHRTGSAGCCPPIEADRIIREFYGIPARSTPVIAFVEDATTREEAKPKYKKVSLTAFL